jgi:hypothetical protein
LTSFGHFEIGGTEGRFGVEQELGFEEGAFGVWFDARLVGEVHLVEVDALEGGELGFVWLLHGGWLVIIYKTINKNYMCGGGSEVVGRKDSYEEFLGLCCLNYFCCNADDITIIIKPVYAYNSYRYIHINNSN